MRPRLLPTAAAHCRNSYCWMCVAFQSSLLPHQSFRTTRLRFFFREEDRDFDKNPSSVLLPHVTRRIDVLAYMASLGYIGWRHKYQSVPVVCR